MTGRFPLGKGGEIPISDADLARLASAGVVIEECERCKGIGSLEGYDEDGAYSETCLGCDGRGCLTADGFEIPETLRTGALICSRCRCSTLSDGDCCDCCKFCGASPAEACDASCESFRAEVA